MESFFKIIYIFAFCVVCIGGAQGICGESCEVPCAKDHSLNRIEKIGSEQNPAVWFVSFFRNYISPVDSDRCKSLPSCSSYSILAFKKHGFFVGWLMTVDRLIHEGDEGLVSPSVYHKGRLRVLDPVDNNDYWWFGKNDSKQE